VQVGLIHHFVYIMTSFKQVEIAIALTLLVESYDIFKKTIFIMSHNQLTVPYTFQLSLSSFHH
jgi:hypothetical protein